MKWMITSGIATAALILGVGIFSVMQDQPIDTPQAEEPLQNTATIQTAQGASTQEIEVKETPITPPATMEPSPSPSVAETATPTPTWNSIDELLDYLNVPADDRAFAKMALLPNVWQKSGASITPTCLDTPYALLQCLNTYVTDKYGSWSGALAARQADPNNHW